MLLAATDPAPIPFHLHADVVLILGAVATFFWWAFTRLGPRLVGPDTPAYTARQRNWVIAGLAWTFVWSWWPLHDIAEKYLFMVHMTQHTVFTLVSPACFLLGAPDWLWRWVLDRRVLGSVVRFASKPIVSLIVFNGLVAVTHWPKVVERSLHNEAFHFSVHLVLFVSATFMWVPVLNKVEGLPRFKAPTKMMYLFAQSIVPTVPASFLTFSKRAMYQTYADAPRMIKSLTAVGDQQIAAAIMKVGAGSYLWAIVGWLFFHWWKDSQAGVADDNVLVSDKWRGGKRPQIAGMTLDGGYVPGTAPIGDAGAGDVLTWDHVQREFERIERNETVTGD